MLEKSKEHPSATCAHCVYYIADKDAEDGGMCYRIFRRMLGTNSACRSVKILDTTKPFSDVPKRR